MSRQFLAFVAVGAAAAALNWLARLAFSAAMPLAPAVAAAYGVGMTAAYLMNRRFVFPPSGRAPAAEFARFAAVNAVAAAQVLAVTLVLARIVFPAIGWTRHAEAVAHAVGVAAPVFTSYLAHRAFTFAGKAHG